MSSCFLCIIQDVRWKNEYIMLLSDVLKSLNYDICVKYVCIHCLHKISCLFQQHLCTPLTFSKIINGIKQNYSFLTTHNEHRLDLCAGFTFMNVL